MHNYRNLSAGLKDDLSSVIDGISTREQLNRVISVFHALASAFLASKSTCSVLSTVTGLKTSDLAYDSIAELFQQNSDGDYVQLVSYFGGLQLSTVRDEEILAHSRRLVFSKVNQGIYRIYSQTDPSLAKILRNVKLAVYSLKNFTESDRFGEQCLLPVLCDSLTHLPPFQQEELEQLFIPATIGNEDVPELLAKLSLVLREQTERCRIVPLVVVALLFRTVYNLKRDICSEFTEIEDATIVSDAMEVISKVCIGLREKMKRKYVKEKKITDELLEKYFDVVKEGLTEKYARNDGQDFSLYENLKKYLPELTRDGYRNEHRNIVEYLWKLAQKETVKQLKE